MGENMKQVMMALLAGFVSLTFAAAYAADMSKGDEMKSDTGKAKSEKGMTKKDSMSKSDKSMSKADKSMAKGDSMSKADAKKAKGKSADSSTK
jgi:hypothetical protein